MENNLRAVTPLSVADVANAVRIAGIICAYYDRQREPTAPVRKASRVRHSTDYLYTLEEVVRELGCTRENARQLQEKALARLRHRHSVRYMREYIA